MLTAAQRDAAILAGLGPILRYVLSCNQQENFDAERKFQSADMTSRVLTDTQAENLGHVIAMLQTLDSTPVVLRQRVRKPVLPYGASADESGQSFVSTISLRIMHNRIEKHLARLEPHGTILTPSVTASIFDTLLCKRTAWKNIVAIPAAILFPPKEPRRFKPGFQLQRISNVLKRRQR